MVGTNMMRASKILSLRSNHSEKSLHFVDSFLSREKYRFYYGGDHMKDQVFTKLLAIGGLVIGAIATLMTNTANEKQMEKMIDEKINDKLK